VVSLDWHHDIASVLDENEKLKRRTERQTAVRPVGQEWRQTEVSPVACAGHHSPNNP
jgi:hypothetical protein